MSTTRLRRNAVRRNPAPYPVASRQDRRPIGQILVETGNLTVQDQLRTLAIQNRVDARFGDILLARDLIDKSTLYAAIARQFGTIVADLIAKPPDMRLVEAFGVERCLSNGILPWRRVKGQIVVATSRPEQFDRVRPDLEALFGAVHMVVTLVVDIHHALLISQPLVLSHKAEDPCPRQRKLPHLDIPAGHADLAGSGDFALCGRSDVADHSVREYHSLGGHYACRQQFA